MKTLGTKDTVIDTLIELFKDNFGSGTFKAYFFGDPMDIPKSMMPCLIIDLNSTSYELGPTQFDEIVHDVLIQAVFNKADDFGKPEKEVGVLRDLHDIVQARDETTGDFLNTSIIGILRRNITIGNLMIETIPTVQFGTVPRPANIITAEAHIQLKVRELQQISNRV